ncbi:hypothetical protein H8356DRAFT_1320659 [Neocallimastix lanati (nom. inval.)]|nr:hypothetical protein H8356DRAFT_1320659 [Neocallimastix sp. JGI-2020a]
MTSSNNTWRNCKAVQQGQHHLLSRKLDKGSRCAAGEKSCYGQIEKLKIKRKDFVNE